MEPLKQVQVEGQLMSVLHGAAQASTGGRTTHVSASWSRSNKYRLKDN